MGKEEGLPWLQLWAWRAQCRVFGHPERKLWARVGRGGQRELMCARCRRVVSVTHS